MKNFFKAEYILYFCSAVALVSSLYFLFRTPSQEQDLPAQSSLGEVLPQGEDVRFRTENEINWNQVNTRFSVFENDRVFTGTSSSAKVTLETKDSFTIEPNSLVVFSKRPREMQGHFINLENGSFVGDFEKGSQWTISSKRITTRIKSKGSQLRLKTNANSDLVLVVLKGSAEIHDSSDSKPRKIEANEEVLFKEKGLQIRTLSITLDTPEESDILWSNTGSVSFHWKSSIPLKESYLEVSESPDFKIQVYSKTVATTSVQADLPLHKMYYWRVSSKEDASTKSPLRSFQLHSLRPPVIDLDEKIQVLADEKDNFKEAIWFAWQDLSLSAEFEIQIAKTSDFSNLLIKKSTFDSEVMVPGLKLGVYFWRVLSKHPLRENLISKVGRISIERKHPLPQPSLESLSLVHQEAAPALLADPPLLDPIPQRLSKKTSVFEQNLDTEVLASAEPPLPLQREPASQNPFQNTSQNITHQHEVQPKPPLGLWFSLGTGYNFVEFEQSMTTQNPVSYANTTGPSLSARGGFNKNKWGVEAGYSQSPGQIKASTVNIDKTNFVWKTFSLEASYKAWTAANFLRLFRLETSLLGGAQHHELPYVTALEDSLFLSSYTQTNLSAGFKSEILSNAWTHQLLVRYQLPIQSKDDSGNSFESSPRFAFDGSIGTQYAFPSSILLGLYWHGQWHENKYSLLQGDGSSDSGNQKLFFSDVELRLGYSF